MTAPSDSMKTRSRARPIVWLAAAVVALVVFVAASLFTDRPQFCTTCHEMGPFYDAWAVGPHAETSCIGCHVGPGIERFTHKFVALKEVYDHFATKPAFPMLGVEVPDSRCLACHEGYASKDDKASHRLHAEGGLPCQKCHGATGHVVTRESLTAASILNSSSMPAGTDFIGELPSAGTVGVALIGHKKVECSKCHDMANASCQACHSPPIGHYGAECSVCHKPSVPFAETVFEHPATNQGEEEGHSYRAFPCRYCHPNGLSTASCTKCHEEGAPKDD